jgi:hypothetical protein
VPIIRTAQAVRKPAHDTGAMPTTLTFPEWLAEQQDRGDDVAAFAKEVANLTDLPDSGGKAIYDGYFETALAAQQQAYRRAWDEFSATPEPSVS